MLFQLNSQSLLLFQLNYQKGSQSLLLKQGAYTDKPVYQQQHTMPCQKPLVTPPQHTMPHQLALQLPLFLEDFRTLAAVNAVSNNWYNQCLIFYCQQFPVALVAQL